MLKILGKIKSHIHDKIYRKFVILEMQIEKHHRHTEMSDMGTDGIQIVLKRSSEQDK
jgi:hypothetical protein